MINLINRLLLKKVAKKIHEVLNMPKEPKEGIRRLTKEELGSKASSTSPEMPRAVSQESADTTGMPTGEIKEDFNTGMSIGEVKDAIEKEVASLKDKAEDVIEDAKDGAKKLLRLRESEVILVDVGQVDSAIASEKDREAKLNVRLIEYLTDLGPIPGLEKLFGAHNKLKRSSVKLRTYKLRDLTKIREELREELMDATRREILKKFAIINKIDTCTDWYQQGVLVWVS